MSRKGLCDRAKSKRCTSLLVVNIVTASERMARIGRAESKLGLNRPITPQDIAANAQKRTQERLDELKRPERRSVVIRVPGCPPSLNKLLRMHWAKRNLLKRQWTNDIKLSAQVMEYAVLMNWAKSRNRLRLRICLRHARLFDKDNAYGSVKVVLDAIKSLGFIADDSPEFIDLEVTQEKSRTVETVITSWEP